MINIISLEAHGLVHCLLLELSTTGQDMANSRSEMVFGIVLTFFFFHKCFFFLYFFLCFFFGFCFGPYQTNGNPFTASLRVNYGLGYSYWIVLVVISCSRFRNHSSGAMREIIENTHIQNRAKFWVLRFSCDRVKESMQYVWLEATTKIQLNIPFVRCMLKLIHLHWTHESVPQLHPCDCLTISCRSCQ